MLRKTIEIGSWPNIGGAVSVEQTNATFEDFLEYKAALWIWKICSPLLIVLGTIGNLMALVVLTRKRLRRSPAMFYLSVLAVVDITVLYSGLLRLWLEYVYDIRIRELSELTCRFHTFFVYFILSFSVWILVAVTIDRCIIVCSPFRAKMFSSLSIARKTVSLIAAALVIFNLHILFTQTMLPTEYFEGGIRCSHATGSKYFRDYVWPWMELTICCVIPVTIMVICNSLIIHRIAVSAKRLKHHMENELCSMKASQKPGKSIQSLSIIALDVSKQRLPTQDTKGGSSTSKVEDRSASRVVTKKIHNRSSSLTVMLLVVTFVFVMLVLPITVYLIGFHTWVQQADEQVESRLELGWAIVNILQYTNNSINFFLYCLTGPRFRQELISMVRSTFSTKRVEPSDTVDRVHGKNSHYSG